VITTSLAATAVVGGEGWRGLKAIKRVMIFEEAEIPYALREATLNLKVDPVVSPEAKKLLPRMLDCKTVNVAPLLAES
jgi:hypothetical protein